MNACKNDHHRADMKWISVKERLPDTDDVVIAQCGGSRLLLAFYMGSRRVLKEGWWELVNGDVEELNEVNYWMPLPPPPKDA